MLKPQKQGVPPCSISCVGSAMEGRNRLLGAIYGEGRIAEWHATRRILIGLNRTPAVMYTRDVLHTGFDSMVRNYADLAEYGVRMA